MKRYLIIMLAALMAGVVPMSAPASERTYVPAVYTGGEGQFELVGHRHRRHHRHHRHHARSHRHHHHHRHYRSYRSYRHHHHHDCYQPYRYRSYNIIVPGFGGFYYRG